MSEIIPPILFSNAHHDVDVSSLIKDEYVAFCERRKESLSGFFGIKLAFMGLVERLLGGLIRLAILKGRPFVEHEFCGSLGIRDHQSVAGLAGLDDYGLVPVLGHWTSPLNLKSQLAEALKVPGDGRIEPDAMSRQQGNACFHCSIYESDTSFLGRALAELHFHTYEQRGHEAVAFIRRPIVKKRLPGVVGTSYGFDFAVTVANNANWREARHGVHGRGLQHGRAILGPLSTRTHLTLLIRSHVLDGYSAPFRTCRDGS